MGGVLEAVDSIESSAVEVDDAPAVDVESPLPEEDPALVGAASLRVIHEVGSGSGAWLNTISDPASSVAAWGSLDGI